MRCILTILLVIISFNLAFNQQIIKGIIYDSEKNPILGANVIIKGSTIGTVTDINGSFSINAKEGDILVISFTGYSAHEILLTPENVNEDIELKIGENYMFVQIPTYKDLKKKLKAIRDSCDMESQKIINLGRMDSWEPVRLLNELKKLDDNCQKKQDNIYNYELVVPGAYRAFFPLVNHNYAIRYYEGLNTFNFFDENFFGFGTNNTNFSNKLVTVYGGGFQFSLNSNLSKANSLKLDLDKVKNFTTDQLQSYLFELDSLNRANTSLMKIASGGGEASINLKTVFINFGMKNEKTRWKFQSEILLRSSFDFPVADKYTERKDWSIFGCLGLTNNILYNFIASDGKPSLVTIFGAYNPWIITGSEKFYNNANFVSRKPIIMHDFSIGLRYDYVDLFFTKQVFSKEFSTTDKLSGRVGLRFNNLFQNKK